MEYIYGVVSTGDIWYFTIFTSNNELATTHKAMFLSVNIEDSNDKILRTQLNNVFAIIGGLLKDKLDSIKDNNKDRQNRIHALFNRKRQKII